VVPRRMKLHFIAPIPIAIVRVKHRSMLIRERPPLDRLRASQLASKLIKRGACPTRAFPHHRFAQRPIGGKQVVIDQRRRLIRNFVIH
jgi:hypothetical protein